MSRVAQAQIAVRRHHNAAVESAVAQVCGPTGPVLESALINAKSLTKPPPFSENWTQSRIFCASSTKTRAAAGSAARRRLLLRLALRRALRDAMFRVPKPAKRA